MCRLGTWANMNGSLVCLISCVSVSLEVACMEILVSDSGFVHVKLENIPRFIQIRSAVTRERSNRHIDKQTGLILNLKYWYASMDSLLLLI